MNFSVNDIANWTLREGSDLNPTQYKWNSNTASLTHFGYAETSHGSSISSSEPGGFFAAGARARVGLGRIQVSLAAIAAITPWDAAHPTAASQTAVTLGGVWGMYEEALTPMVSGHAGEAAELELRFRAPVDETFVQARSSGNSTAVGQFGEFANVLWFQLGDASADFMSGSQAVGTGDGSLHESNPATDFPSLVVLRTPVILGQSVAASIEVALNAFALADGNFAASSTGQLSYWNQGITFAGARLWDPKGVEIPEFTLRNQDGRDFRRDFGPVPEPSTYGAFAGAGLLLLVLATRRGKARCAM